MRRRHLELLGLGFAFGFVLTFFVKKYRFGRNLAEDDEPFLFI
jgi:hypothetical protein